MYIALATRPDVLLLCVSALARHRHDPAARHWKAALFVRARCVTSLAQPMRLRTYLSIIVLITALACRGVRMQIMMVTAPHVAPPLAVFSQLLVLQFREAVAS